MSVSDRKIDALLLLAVKDLIDEDAETARSTDTSNTQISEKTLRRINRKIKNYEKESWWSSIPAACRRAVAAILIVCTVSFGLCLSIDAVRAEIVSTILEWYDKFVSVFYVPEETPPSTIQVYREPMLQIAGTERQVIMQTEHDYYIIYTLNDNDVSVFCQQMVISNTSVDFDSENGCVQRTVDINGYKATLFEYDDGRYNITWHDNEYVYTILTESINIDSDMAVNIARSVK